VSHQGSVDGAEGGVCCFLSVIGHLRKLNNDAAFGGRVDLLPPLGLSRNDGLLCGIDILGRLRRGRDRLCSSGCADSLCGGGRGGRLLGGCGSGRVTRRERRQLLRNGGDLLRQSSKVLQLRGRGNGGTLEKATNLLGKCSNSLNQSGVEGSNGSRGGGRSGA
jgi:hypothetical protein